MNAIRTAVAAALTLGSVAAQAPDAFLFTMTNVETTLSGSSGTSLQTLYPNEISFVSPGFPSCTTFSAEKWAPRTAFHTMAGDENADDMYWRPNTFGAIDAVMVDPTAPFEANARNVYYSPAQPLGTAVSGAPGLRPGDVGRIARIGASEGQIQYFITAEQVQIALGLPPAPVVVNIDAAAFSAQFGFFFSLEADTPVGLCGALGVRDGDILMIPTGAIAYTGSMTVAAVAPASAVVVYNELAVNTMVVNAGVKDRDGICCSTIIDVDALELDLFAPVTPITWCGSVYPVPAIIFAGERLTGASVLDTQFGGRIRPNSCGGLGTPCSSISFTSGAQMGVQPTSAVQGCASSVNALAQARSCRFVLESPNPTALAPAPLTIDMGAPPTTFVWVFASPAVGGVAAVTPSVPFFWSPTFCYPDVHLPTPVFLGTTFTDPQGFASLATGPLAFPIDVHCQGIYIDGGGNLQLSTPATIELF